MYYTRAMAKRKWKGNLEKAVMISVRITAEQEKTLRAAYHKWAAKQQHWDSSFSRFLRDRILQKD